MILHALFFILHMTLNLEPIEQNFSVQEQGYLLVWDSHVASN